MRKLSLLIVVVLFLAVFTGCNKEDRTSSAGNGQFGEAPVENVTPTEEIINIHQLWMSLTTNGVALDFSDPDRVLFTTDFDETEEEYTWSDLYVGRILEDIRGQEGYDKVFDEPTIDLDTNAPLTPENFHYMVLELTQEEKDGTTVDLENPQTMTVWFWPNVSAISGREGGQFHFLEGYFYFERIDAHNLLSVESMIANPTT